MFLFNDHEIKVEHFPDGTPKINLPFITQSSEHQKIVWRYENETECMVLWHITNHIKSIMPKTKLHLHLPYIPNARFDRTYHDREVFTMKWFAKFINTLEFDSVVVLDPHSNVSAALIDRVQVVYPVKQIKSVLESLHNDGYQPVLYFPDAGAMKRYHHLFDGYYVVYGEKNRDWETGEIVSLSLRGCIESLESLEKPAFLMIDDICSYGGTFYYSAKTLKDAFPHSKIYSWATHTENDFPTLQKAFDQGLITEHYTTNSFYCHTHDKIKTFFIC